MQYHVVTFAPTGLSAEVLHGETIKQAASKAGVDIDTPCGGLGTCGRCAVRVSGRLAEPGPDEITLLGHERLSRGIRLACRAEVTGDVTVSPFGAAGANRRLRILEGGMQLAIEIEPPTERGITGDRPLLGAVVDVGTTTLVAAVIDLESGERVGSASDLNPQHHFGHDVLSRISQAGVVGIEALRRPVIESIESLISLVLAGADIDESHLREVAVAGNTTMVHLLLGIDPAPLGVAPYGPAFLAPVERPAVQLGFKGMGDPSVYLLPGSSAFVGADITAGLLATGIAEQERVALFVDLGTNGEIVLRSPSGLLAASTAAGPALEGATIGCGMRAEPGAIERVSLGATDEIVIGTVEDTLPIGICGSGLLDLVAVLLDTGVIDTTGRLRGDAAHPLAERVAETPNGRIFNLTPGIHLSQKDIREVQLAKAAIATGIEMLLRAANTPAEKVERLVIAGGFGYHVRAGALVRMGMIPAALRDRVSFAGNTAMAGARMVLLSTDARRRAEAIAGHVRTLDLAASPEFQTRFIAAMDFPSKRQ